jgi:hypothetical protein
VRLSLLIAAMRSRSSLAAAPNNSLRALNDHPGGCPGPTPLCLDRPYGLLDQQHRARAANQTARQDSARGSRHRRAGACTEQHWTAC